MIGAGDDLPAIRDGLAGAAESLALALLGEPNRSLSNRSTWRFGSKGSFKIEVAGPKRGLWVDHGAGDEGGDLLALIQRERGGDFPAALEWARGYLRMPEQHRPKPKAILPVSAPPASDADRIAKARRLWAACKPLVGTVGETYLAVTRGIPAPAAGWPDAVRFHPMERALVVAATDAAGAVVAVQFVYLTPGAEKISEAEAKRRRVPKDAKQSFGPVTGSVVRLPGDPDGPLLLAEGPETGLSVWAATGAETWIALGSMAKVLPPDDRQIIACADDDAAGSSSAKTLGKAVTAWAAEGVEIAVATPWAEQRQNKTDFNDTIKAGGIDAVRARIAAAVAVEAEEAAPGQPHFTRPWLNSNAAARRLRLVVAVFLNRMERRWDAAEWIAAEAARIRPEMQQATEARLFAKLRLAGKDSEDAGIEAAQRAGRAAAGVAKAQARRTAVRLFGRRAVAGKMPALQIKGAAGLGKTTAFLEEYLRRPALWRRHINFYVPELALADELRDKLAKLIAEARQSGKILIAPGSSHPRSTVIYGRQSKGMCHAERLLLIEAANDAGVDSVFRGFCHTPASGDITESYCPFWKGCSERGYISQFADKEPMLRFLTHARMTKGTPDELKLPPADLALVDETALNSMVSSRVIDPAIFGDLANYASEPGQEDRIQEAADIGQRVAAAMQAGGDAVALLVAGGITPDMLRGAAQAAILAADNARPALHASLGKAAVFERLAGRTPHQGRAIAAVFRQLARDIEAGRLASVGVEWDGANELKLEDGSKVLHPVIRQHSIQAALGIPSNAGLLLIDADANLGINRRLFGDNLRGVTIAAVRQAFVIQASDHALAKSTLVFPNADNKDGKLRDKIAVLVEREATGGKRVLVVMPLAVRRKFTGEADSRVSDYVSWLGAELTHFGRLLGKDRWKDFDTVIVVGREEITAIDAERTARALYADADSVHLDLTGRYVTEKRQHDLQQGLAPAVAVRVHPDARVQAVLEIMREGGIGQALDRLRLVHRHPDKPGRVLVVSNIPVPGLVVDELLPLDDLLAGGTVWDRAMARMPGGVLPLSAPWLVANLPDLFPSVRTAKRDIETKHKVPTGNRDYNCQVALFGIGEKGRKSKALVLTNNKFETVEAELGRLLGKPVREVRMPNDTVEVTPLAALPEPVVASVSITVPGQLIHGIAPMGAQILLNDGLPIYGVQPGVTFISDAALTHVQRKAANDADSAVAGGFVPEPMPPLTREDDRNAFILLAWRERIEKARKEWHNEK